MLLFAYITRREYDRFRINKKAYGRLDAIEESVKILMESLSNIYADTQIAYYLLYLAENQDKNK